VEQILKARKSKPSWGPKKLQDLLRCKHGLIEAPARSTIASVSKFGQESRPDVFFLPKSSPNATARSVEALILKERRRRRTWGPKKIRDLLIEKHGIEMPPHESTIALTLHRHGLSQKPKRKVGVHRVRPEHLTEPTRPNEVWTVDFKGWFTLGDGQRCEPLTVCDRYSRYIIGWGRKMTSGLDF
jgi:hypothetical protein